MQGIGPVYFSNDFAFKGEVKSVLRIFYARNIVCATGRFVYISSLKCMGLFISFILYNCRWYR